MGKKWRKQCMDWADKKTFFNYSLVRKSVMHKKINYDLVLKKFRQKVENLYVLTRYADELLTGLGIGQLFSFGLNVDGGAVAGVVAGGAVAGVVAGGAVARVVAGGAVTGGVGDVWSEDCGGATVVDTTSTICEVGGKD